MRNMREIPRHLARFNTEAGLFQTEPDVGGNVERPKNIEEVADAGPEKDDINLDSQA